MNLGTRLRGRPRNRWQGEVREDGRMVGGEGWQEKVHDREERKKLPRTARNRRVLRTPTERTNRIIKGQHIGHSNLRQLHAVGARASCWYKSTLFFTAD